MLIKYFFFQQEASVSNSSADASVSDSNTEGKDYYDSDYQEDYAVKATNGTKTAKAKNNAKDKNNAKAKNNAKGKTNAKATKSGKLSNYKLRFTKIHHRSFFF